MHLGVIVLGAGSYGAAMGWWRAPEQALFVAIKFPLIILLVTAGNALINGMLAPLLGLNLRFRESVSAIVMSFTVAVVCAAAYGVVAGTFSGGAQLWAAPVKIAGGLLVSGLICLPSLYIFGCLSGSRARLVEVCGLLAGLLMLLTILLVGFAPVVWIFSQSTESLAWMGTLHLIFGIVAAMFGINFIHNGFEHSEIKSPVGLNVWVVIFLLVALQMMTSLRPIIGTADTLLPTEKKFFLSHWASCLYDTPERR